MPVEHRIRAKSRANQTSSKNEIRGIAVPYNEASSPLPGAGREFREIMQPGALTVSGETVLILQHDQSGIPLARVSAGTLSFRSTDAGLEFTATLPESRKELHEALERGDMDGSVSVGMYVDRDEWTHGKETSIRKVTSGRLVELSLVSPAGAYASAKVEGGPNG